MLFFLFFFSFILFSLIGFFIIRTTFHDVWDDHLPEQSMSISGSILAVLSIFVSVPLSIIILFLWTNYNDTIQIIQSEMNQTLLMYKTIHDEKLLKTMKLYIDRKITYHKFRTIVYQYNDTQLINMVNSIAPNEFTTDNHVNAEVWLVIVIGVLSVMIGTWFVKSPFLLHLYLVMSVAGVLGTLVFLVYYYNTIDCYTCIREELQRQLINKIQI